MIKLTLDEIIALIAGKVIQAGSANEVSGLASLDEAEPSDISFLGNEKYFQDYLQTRAGIVLVPPGLPDQPPACTIIEVENPSRAFGEVVKYFAKERDQFTPGIHSGAHVSADAKLDPSRVCIKAGAIVEAGVSIGNGTEIGAGAVVASGVKIGENCLLYANVTVREDCVIGNRVILHSGCVIGSDGYGYELVEGKHVKVDQVGSVIIEDDVEIGSNSTIDRARFGKTIIGEGTKVDNLVQIGHNVRIGKHCLVVAQSGIAGSAHIGDYVTLAAQSGCGGHVKIGDQATLTARTGVTKDIKGGVIYMGMPARPMREEMQKKAAIARLPKLIAEMKELRRRLDGKG